MTKKDFIAAIAERSGLTKKDAEKAVDAFLETVTSELEAGNAVQFTGFGTFDVKARKEKTCINPKTKEKMTVPACKSPTFKPGKALKEAISK